MPIFIDENCLWANLESCMQLRNDVMSESPDVEPGLPATCKDVPDVRWKSAKCRPKRSEEADPSDRIFPVPLHPHHGLCFSFFRGKGYSEEFTDNMRRLLMHLIENDPYVMMTLRPDPVCGACPNNQNGACISNEKIIKYDRAVLSLCGLEEGDILPFSSFIHLVQIHILDAGKRRDVCGDCEWDGLCN